MKNSTKVLAVTVVATMVLGSVSVFAAEAETTTNFERLAFARNMKVKDCNFKFGKRFELNEEQKAAMAEKIESDEFKPMAKSGKRKRAFAKKAPKSNNNTTEVSE